MASPPTMNTCSKKQHLLMDHPTHQLEDGMAILDTLICLGCNKDLWSWRSKYKSYGALRGVQSGGKGLSPGVCGK